MGAGMFNMALNFAEMERRRIGERTRETMARIKTDNPDKHMGRPSTLPASTLERIRTLRAGGASLAATARTLTAENAPTATGGGWYPSTIRRVESSAAYRATPEWRA